LLQFIVKYYLGDHFRKDKKGTAAAWMGEKANSYRNLIGKSEERESVVVLFAQERKILR